MRILLLGHRGMAGHIIYDYLKSKENYKVVSADELLGFKFNALKHINDLKEKLEVNPVDYIINCIGLLVKKCEENPVDAIKINSLFPHELVTIVDKIGAQFIHLSTDCYLDDNVYGRSKRAGEINYPNHLTIRTSIIGPELKKDGVGLFAWFMRQKGEVKGYTNVMWDGITTLELAKFIGWYIQKRNKKYGIKNLRSSQPISKYDLLKLIKKIYGKNIKINKLYVPGVKDKTAKNEFLDYKIPTYEQMIKEMFEFQKNFL